MRSAHAATTVRARDTVKSAHDPVCCGPKQTTSHRPYPGRDRPGPIAPSSPSTTSGSCPGPASAGPNAGDLFSNTATSYRSGTSVGFPGVDGASGSSSSGGRNARSWRAAAIEIHSPVSGSCRSSGTGGRGTGGRVSAARDGPSDRVRVVEVDQLTPVTQTGNPLHNPRHDRASSFRPGSVFGMPEIGTGYERRRRDSPPSAALG